MTIRRFVVLSGLTLLTSACGGNVQTSGTKSLTDGGYQGHKYYFGWGLNDNGNGSMDNEVKYDVLHTHDIFTKDVGGDYIGTKLIGGNQVSGRAIKSQWSTLTSQMQSTDMYLQYSSGHGYPGGLEAGVTYNDIINAVIGMPVQETVMFTMACYSGGLVDSFNRARSRWQDYQANGRTLFVMASSRADEESSTGPGTDPDQPSSPYGSAGSAYGHALWKALIGYADGAVDSKKDGVITLGEIIKYVVQDTQREGGHTPVYTGTYDPQLKIAKVPTVQEAQALLGDTQEARLRLQELINDDVVH